MNFRNENTDKSKNRRTMVRQKSKHHHEWYNRRSQISPIKMDIDTVFRLCIIVYNFVCLFVCEGVAGGSDGKLSMLVISLHNTKISNMLYQFILVAT